MTTKAAKKIAHLRDENFQHWHFSLWMLKRRTAGRDVFFSSLHVDVDKKLQSKLKRAVTGRLKDTSLKLVPYEFLSEDQDDRVMTLEVDETSFGRMRTEVDKGTANRKAEKYEDLLGAWAYVVKLEHGENVLYGVRKISQYTRAAKLAASGSISQLLFRDKQLTDLEDEKVFTLDMKVDFLAYDGTIFIANKRDFESVLNFREGMEKNRDSVLEELAVLKIFSDIEPIRSGVGVNLNLLRRISSIQKSGYYKSPEFIASLIAISNEKQWGLKINNGTILVDEDSVDLILKLLNNDRLESPINQEMFDAAVKRKVS